MSYKNITASVKLSLMICATLMLLSYNAYSTCDTLPVRNIKITPWQAINILGDAKFTDQLKLRDTLQTTQIINLDMLYQRVLNDGKRKDATIASQEILISSQEELLKEKDKRLSDFEKRLKRSIRIGRFKIVLLTAAVVGGGYLIIKK